MKRGEDMQVKQEHCKWKEHNKVQILKHKKRAVEDKEVAYASFC